MRSAIIIPARYSSSRLPGKPLLRATGKFLVQHVYEQACQARADIVVVATDDERIQQAVQSFGGRVVMTRSDHPSGSDRCAEVVCIAAPAVAAVNANVASRPVERRSRRHRRCLDRQICGHRRACYECRKCDASEKQFSHHTSPAAD